MGIPIDLTTRVRDIVGSEAYLDSPADTLSYGFNSYPLYTQPAAVVLFQAREQIEQVLPLLYARDVPMVIRGSGTNIAGSALAPPGGVVLSLERMKKILEIDPVSRYARAEAGANVTNVKAIQELAGQHGLFFPPNPGNVDAITVGGIIGCNSSGDLALGYGATRGHALARARPVVAPRSPAALAHPAAVARAGPPARPLAPCRGGAVRRAEGASSGYADRHVSRRVHHGERAGRRPARRDQGPPAERPRDARALGAALLWRAPSSRGAPRGAGCCGAAGLWSAQHPEAAWGLLQPLLDAIEGSGCEVVASSNPGCLFHIRAGLRARGSNIRALHLAELLDAGVSADERER